MEQIPNILGERLYQLDRAKLTALAETICSELSARGAYFGGIRPDNIGYSDDGNVMLGAPAGDGTEQRSTSELEFMAPEVFWSGAQSPAADVYSVGLLLYAGVANGQLPFYGDNPTPTDRADALKRRMNGEALPIPRAAGKELAAIIRKATAFRVADRYQTPDALRAALTQYRADLRASIPTAKEMFDKPEQELSEVERMMLGILAARAVDVGEPETEEVEASKTAEQDIEVEVVEMEPEKVELPPEVEEAAASIERRQSKPQETIIVTPHPKAELPENKPVQPEPEAAQPKKAEPGFVDVPAAKPEPEKAPAPARKKLPEQPSDAALARKRKASEVSDRVEEVAWLGKDQETKPKKQKKGGQIALIILLVLVAAALFALILNQLGYIDFGGGSQQPTDVAETTPTAEVTAQPDTSTAPEPTDEPEPSTTPEPTATPVPVSTYEVVLSNASWEQAKTEAQNKGGHLVVIDSSEELQQVINLAAGSGAEYVWIGLYRTEIGELTWVVPAEASIMSWAPGEPTVTDASTGAPENYVLLRNYNGSWYYNDIMNDPVTNYPGIFGGRVAYIVEYQE